jgi:hypothetical protein
LNRESQRKRPKRFFLGRKWTINEKRKEKEINKPPAR